MTRQYNDPTNGSPSTIGNQFNTFYYQKQALIEARKLQFFGQLADVTSMPKNMGKKIKRFHYIPLLDDANLNDQGIDAAGVDIDSSKFEVYSPHLVFKFDVEADATAAAAAANDIEASVAVKTGSASPWTVTLSKNLLSDASEVKANAFINAFPGSYKRKQSGNLYGSSKDVGFISGKLPLLGENGGRVNRVGFKRKELEGTFEKFGFFDEYTQESLDFDTDAELIQHINREMLNGAMEITEDALQMDLLNAAGVVKLTGTAVTVDQVANTVSYGDLIRLSIDLDNNRTPKQTKVITGTRLIDTRTIPGGRVMYVGSELLVTLQKMQDFHNKPAWIPVEKYAAGGTILNGEEGSIGPFRVVVVPEMMKWAGAGAAATGSDRYATNGRYDVFPMLVVGSESFTTIGFQTDGKTVKFKIYHKKPGEQTADRNDPYGETGFMSIKWYYGFMALRPERIGLIKTTALL